MATSQTITVRLDIDTDDIRAQVDELAAATRDAVRPLRRRRRLTTAWAVTWDLAAACLAAPVIFAFTMPWWVAVLANVAVWGLAWQVVAARAEAIMQQAARHAAEKRARRLRDPLSAAPADDASRAPEGADSNDGDGATK